MPRGRKKKADTEPTTATEAASAVMERLQGQGLDVKPATEALTQLEPSVLPEEPGPHAAAVLASRPKMQTVPPGFMNVASYPEAGIRVNKSLDKRVVTIQFAQDRLPTRAEKDILERVGQPQDGLNFVYRTGTRQWQREVPEGLTPGSNIIEAMNVARQLAEARGEGRNR